MKAYWLTLAARIDRLTLRQRVGVFAGCAAVVLYLVFMLAFDPLLREQARLEATIKTQRAAMTGVDTQITTLVDAYARDPDAGTRTRLTSARQEARTLGASLAAMQQGLVAPEQMVPLLQTILRANGRLQLVALTTLPVTPVGGPPATSGSVPGAASVPAPAAAPAAASASAPASAPAAQPSIAAPAMAGLLYRHGVQVTVRGSYLDMVDYMAALEGLPTQLFWGGAQFQVEEYPRAQLTLTLYTLSLDRKWMKL
ncbi:MAG: type II secretion system protein M [Pseudomonadota bacterium]|nr:type II secretion system protein M [Pseudomonadota bacterium]